jgi:CPA2 family monovalent cation:H+ antiporter-2
MPETFHWETYKEALLFLGTAGVIVPLFRRLHLSPVLGFLAAGVLLGPYGLGRLASSAGWVSSFSLTNPEAVAAVGEFGVVFLLFMIGLELSWERLQRMRRLIFGLGAAQVIVCATVLAALASWLGMGPRNAIIFGAALSLSSTAIAIPVLAERRRLTTGAGGPRSRSCSSRTSWSRRSCSPSRFSARRIPRGRASRSSPNSSGRSRRPWPRLPRCSCLDV